MRYRGCASLSRPPRMRCISRCLLRCVSRRVHAPHTVNGEYLAESRNCRQEVENSGGTRRHNLMIQVETDIIVFNSWAVYTDIPSFLCSRALKSIYSYFYYGQWFQTTNCGDVMLRPRHAHRRESQRGERAYCGKRTSSKI